MCTDASSLFCSLFARHASTVTKKTADHVMVLQAALKKHPFWMPETYQVSLGTVKLLVASKNLSTDGDVTTHLLCMVI